MLRVLNLDGKSNDDDDAMDVEQGSGKSKSGLKESINMEAIPQDMINIGAAVRSSLFCNNVCFMLCFNIVRLGRCCQAARSYNPASQNVVDWFVSS